MLFSYMESIRSLSESSAFILVNWFSNDSISYTRFTYIVCNNNLLFNVHFPIVLMQFNAFMFGS